MALNGSFNVTRRANRSYETFHRDKRRTGVDRLGMLETRSSGRRRTSGLREFLSALSSILRRRR